MLVHPTNTDFKQAPVIMLDLRPRFKNRAARRRAIFGKQSVFNAIKGRLSPKSMRESRVL
jgi:hypothetical protein